MHEETVQLRSSSTRTYQTPLDTTHFTQRLPNVFPLCANSPKPYLLKHGIPGEAVAAYPLSWHSERVGFVYSISLDNLW